MKQKISFRIILILSVIVFFITFHFVTKTVVASTFDDKDQFVTSIQIKEGDSLWSIASLYYTDEYKNMSEYINQIKKSNKLSSDKIYAGQYIIVPYYPKVDL